MASGLQVSTFGDDTDQPVRFFIYADVLQELVKAARYRRENATALLTGQYCVNQRGPFVEVTGFRDMQYLYGDDAVEMTRPVLLEFLENRDQHDRVEEQLVGVFAGRPQGQAELDEETARLHLSLFNIPFQLALVIDGVHDRLAVYARALEQPFFNAAFSIVEEQQGECDGEVADKENEIAMESER